MRIFLPEPNCYTLLYPYIGSSHSKNSNIHQTFTLMSTQKRHLTETPYSIIKLYEVLYLFFFVLFFFSPFSLFSAPLPWNSHFRINTSPKTTNRKCLSTKHLTMLFFQTRYTLKVYTYFYCFFLIFNNIQLKQFYGLHSVKAIFIVRQTLL